jgi:hypothetical protein
MPSMIFYREAAVERAMKVQEVILRAMAKKITWWQAAEILGLSDRSMRRWREQYEEFGYDGLFDRRQGKPSPKRVPVAVVEQVLGLYRDRYFDLNVRHWSHRKRWPAHPALWRRSRARWPECAGTQRQGHADANRRQPHPEEVHAGEKRFQPLPGRRRGQRRTDSLRLMVCRHLTAQALQHGHRTGARSARHPCCHVPCAMRH